MIIIPSLSIILNISIVGIIINISHILILIFGFAIAISFDVSLEVISQCWILIKSNSFEFSIGIETKDHSEEIVDKANDWDCIVIFLFACVSTDVSFVLNGSQEEYQVSYCKENTNKYEQHYYLITTLMLATVKDQQEEQTE